MELKKQRNHYLTNARKKLGLDNKEFSKYLGIHPTLYTSYETLHSIPGEKRQENIINKIREKGIELNREKVFSRKLYESYKKDTMKNKMLKQIRSQMKINITKFAEELGMQNTYYSAIENLKLFPGKNCKTKILDYLSRKGINISEEELFPENIYHKHKKKIGFGPIIEIENNRDFSEEGEDWEIFNQESLNNSLERIINTLPLKEANIIKKYYGILGEEEKSISELSIEMKLSKESIYQLRSKGLVKLKQKDKTSLLIDFL